jgi:hypothetical protein
LQRQTTIGSQAAPVSNMTGLLVRAGSKASNPFRGLLNVTAPIREAFSDDASIPFHHARSMSPDNQPGQITATGAKEYETGKRTKKACAFPSAGGTANGKESMPFSPI